MKLKFISGKWIVIFLHVALWALFITYPYILRHSFGEHGGAERRFNLRFELHNLINIISWISLFYVNAYILMPRYFNKKKYNQYAFSLLLSFMVLFSINWLSFNIFISGKEFKIIGSVMFYMIPTVFVLIWSVAYRLLLDKVREDKMKSQMQNENLKTELSFLRSQVSPHFMFNVLNNMVSLARKKSDLLEPSLIKLSSLLRYMLYETDEDMVTLQKEIEYLQSYIDLQRQRFGENVIINVSMKKVNDQHQIHPMLLIPFVENAFKHGTGMMSKPEINITLRSDAHKLYFDVRNKFNDNTEEIKDKASGIGLANVQRRLNLLYGNNHRLDIKNTDGWFTVSLEIGLT